VRWPPRERDWHELLRPLSADADRAAVRKAVEEAAREYVEHADRERRWRHVWTQVGRRDGLRNFQEFCQRILQLRDFPLDPGTKALLSQVELLGRMRPYADIRAAVLVSIRRRARFMSCLASAWTGPGKGQLSTTDSQRFVDFIRPIYECVSGRSISSFRIKQFMTQEKVRRAMLSLLEEI
jgi:hypothetical protein